MVETVKLSIEVLTSTLQLGTLGSIASLLAATLYQGNHNRNHKLWNIGSTVAISVLHRHFDTPIIK